MDKRYIYQTLDQLLETYGFEALLETLAEVIADSPTVDEVTAEALEAELKNLSTKY